MLIFEQTKEFSYRDPAAYIVNDKIYLFFTLVENTEDNQFFYVAQSESSDFINWTKPIILTEKDNMKKYSSPGNVFKYDGYYYLTCRAILVKKARFTATKVPVFSL